MLICRPFYGLFVNKTLKKGNTHECETFCNPMLTDEESFKIIKLEVTNNQIWGFREPVE